MSEAEKQYAIAAARWRKIGPAAFAAEAMGATPTPQQLDAGRALVESRRISIRSGHGTGKSAFMAWSVIWFVACYFPSRVPCTAPTSHQLEDVLWSEIAKWHRALCDKLPEVGALFEWSKEAYRLKEAPQEGFAVARTARPEKPEALQGFHAQNLLFLIDEASGVSDNVFQVAEGALSTPDCYVVMAANPTRRDGYFFDSHHKDRAHWATLAWSGIDSPMVSREYVEQMKSKYGERSPVYKVRVLGEFVDAADGVIGLDLCEAAVGRHVEQTQAPVIWGVDVARFGDDSSALAKRRGNWQLEPVREWWGKDTMQTAGLILAEWEKTKPDQRPVAINVDVIGIGAGVVDRLKELNLPVKGINVAEAEATNSSKRQYNRLRDELWFECREWLEAKDCRMCDDQETIAELVTPTYSILSNGLIKVEGKDEMKKRGVKSPNRADAWNLTFAKISFASSVKKPINYPNLGMPGTRLKR